MRVFGIFAALAVQAAAAQAQVFVDGSDRNQAEFTPPTFSVFLRFAVDDPLSAQVAALRRVGPYLFCGEINAKNSQGAYTGFRAFSVDMTSGEIVIDPNGADLSEGPLDPRLTEICKK